MYANTVLCEGTYMLHLRFPNDQLSCPSEGLYNIKHTKIHFSIQSMIVTPSPKENIIKLITRSLYSVEFLFGTNIVIDKTLIFLDLMEYSQY